MPPASLQVSEIICPQIFTSFNQLYLVQDLKKAMELLSLTQAQGAVKTTEDAMAKQYEFWSTQPVPKISKISVSFVF